MLVAWKRRDPAKSFALEHRPSPSLASVGRPSVGLSQRPHVQKQHKVDLDREVQTSASTMDFIESNIEMIKHYPHNGLVIMG